MARNGCPPPLPISAGACGPSTMVCSPFAGSVPVPPSQQRYVEVVKCCDDVDGNGEGDVTFFKVLVVDGNGDTQASQTVDGAGAPYTPISEVPCGNQNDYELQEACYQDVGDPTTRYTRIVFIDADSQEPNGVIWLDDSGQSIAEPANVEPCADFQTEIVKICKCDDVNGDETVFESYVEIWRVTYSTPIVSVLVGTFTDASASTTYTPANPIDCNEIGDNANLQTVPMCAADGVSFTRIVNSLDGTIITNYDANFAPLTPLEPATLGYCPIALPKQTVDIEDCDGNAVQVDVDQEVVVRGVVTVKQCSAEKFIGQVCVGQIVFDGDPVALNQDSFTLPLGTTYTRTGGGAGFQYGNVAGDQRIDGAEVTHTFTKPVLLLVSPITSTNIGDPLTWTHRNGVGPTNPASTRLVSNGGAITYAAGSVNLNPFFSNNDMQVNANLPDNSGVTASDLWGLFTVPDATNVTIRPRQADAMNLSVIEGRLDGSNPTTLYGYEQPDGSIVYKDLEGAVVAFDPELVVPCPLRASIDPVCKQELADLIAEAIKDQEGEKACYADISQAGADLTENGVVGNLNSIQSTTFNSIISNEQAFEFLVAAQDVSYPFPDFSNAHIELNSITIEFDMGGVGAGPAGPVDIAIAVNGVTSSTTPVVAGQGATVHTFTFPAGTTITPSGGVNPARTYGFGWSIAILPADTADFNPTRAMIRVRSTDAQDVTLVERGIGLVPMLAEIDFNYAPPVTATITTFPDGTKEGVDGNGAALDAAQIADIEANWTVVDCPTESQLVEVSPYFVNHIAYCIADPADPNNVLKAFKMYRTDGTFGERMLLTDIDPEAVDCC